MIKIHPNILVGSLHDLSQIINSVNFIINCSLNLNNAMTHPNYLNLNINQFSLDSLQTLNSVYDFVIGKISLNQNIFLLCETGIDKSLILGIFIMMKLYNLSYHTTYYNIAATNKINNYDSYSGLKNYEPYIGFCGSGEKMDIS